MLIKLFRRLYELRFQFIRYFTIGVSAVILDIGSLFIFKEYLDWHPVTAVIVNQLVIVNYVFFLNKYWAFKSRGMTHKQMVRFYLLAVGNYLFAVGWMWLWYSILGFDYPIIIRLSNVALAVAWNFLLYRYWVYNSTDLHRL